MASYVNNYEEVRRSIALALLSVADDRTRPHVREELAEIAGGSSTRDRATLGFFMKGNTQRWQADADIAFEMVMGVSVEDDDGNTWRSIMPRFDVSWSSASTSVEGIETMQDRIALYSEMLQTCADLRVRFSAPVHILVQTKEQKLEAAAKREQMKAEALVREAIRNQVKNMRVGQTRWCDPRMDIPAGEYRVTLPINRTEERVYRCQVGTTGSLRIYRAG